MFGPDVASRKATIDARELRGDVDHKNRLIANRFDEL